MKVLTTAGLTKLIQLCKAAFVDKTDVVETQTVTLATVATSGSYNDLSDKPNIPTVNNATLTIQKNGTTVNTFTANSSSNVTANITVPTVNNPTITITQGGVTKGSFTLNQSSGDTIALDAGGGSSVAVGTVLPFAGATAPTGYLLCDGSDISRTTYSDLFDVIGTTYGAGDGSTTFNIPNGSTRLLSTSIPVIGTDVTMGLTNGTDTAGLVSASLGANAGMLRAYTYAYGSALNQSYSGTQSNLKTMTLTQDATKSGVIADISNLQELKYIIKY